jgi:hypothetical protein
MNHFDPSNSSANDLFFSTFNQVHPTYKEDPYQYYLSADYGKYWETLNDDNSRIQSFETSKIRSQTS